MTRSKLLRRVVLGTLSAALLTLPLLAQPATATSVGAAATVPCTVPTGATPTRAPDTTPVTVGLQRAVERTLVPSRARLAANSRTLPNHILVPVYAHVIKGTHPGESTVSRKKVRRVVAILRTAYRGGQNPRMSPTRYSFTIKSITMTRNDRWYHAEPLSAADAQSKRRLHRGFSRALNIYFSAPASDGSQAQILGFARFPWQVHSAPLQDGVTIHADTLPGGAFRRYNRGDTVVHEVGHWLGLYHTFEGGCGDLLDPAGSGDFVGDTNPEAEPAEGCPGGRRSCVGNTLDPIHNFMDYSFDACMNHLTAGQAARMDAAYLRYRY